MRNTYKRLVGKSKAKKPFGRPRYRRKNTFKMDLEETFVENNNWIYLAEYWDKLQAFVNMVMNFWVLEKR
jgi:hypothetical protein